MAQITSVDIPRLDQVTHSRFDIRDGRAHPSNTPGVGIDWDWDTLEARAVDGTRHRTG